MPGDKTREEGAAKADGGMREGFLVSESAGPRSASFLVSLQGHTRHPQRSAIKGGCPMPPRPALSAFTAGVTQESQAAEEKAPSPEAGRLWGVAGVWGGPDDWVTFLQVQGKQRPRMRGHHAGDPGSEDSEDSDITLRWNVAKDQKGELWVFSQSQAGEGAGRFSPRKQGGGGGGVPAKGKGIFS